MTKSETTSKFIIWLETIQSQNICAYFMVFIENRLHKYPFDIVW